MIRQIQRRQTESEYKAELDSELKTIIKQHGNLKPDQRAALNKRIDVIGQEFRRMGGV